MKLKPTFLAMAVMALSLALQACGEVPSVEHIDEASSVPLAPKSIQVVTPKAFPSRDNTPTLRITGVKSGQTVYVYKSSTCSSTIKQAKAKSSSIDITLSALPNGSYKFYTRAGTSAGKSKCKGYAAYTVDLVAPQNPTITSPSDSSVVGISPILEGTCETGSTVTISGDITPTVNTTCAGGVFSQTITLSGADGSKNLSIKSTDKTGNYSSVSHSLVLDTEAPVISGVNLSNPATSPGTDTTPEIEVTGTFSIGDTFQLFNDMTCTTPISSVVNSTLTTSVMIASDVLTDDNYTFFVQVSDSIGNSRCESIQSVSYTLDTLAPTATITTPMTVINNANKTSYTFAGTCNDNTADVSITAPAGFIGTVPCSSGAFSFTGKNVSGQSDGSVGFTVRIQDVAGNFSTHSASATKDTINPTIAINALATITQSNQTNYSISGTCTTNGDVISITTPVLAGTVTCAAGTFSFTGKNVSGMSDSTTASFTLRNTDAAGNLATATRTTLKDTTPPTNPSCNSLAGDATPTKSDTVTWSGSTDATSGINHYEMSIGISYPQENIAWTNIGSSVIPHRFTGISPKLLFKNGYGGSQVDYITYIRAIDNVGLVSSEIACDPWHLKPAYGNFQGTENTDLANPTILNQDTAYDLIFSASKFNSSYFEHRISSEKISINEPGNYLLSLVLPLTRVDGNLSSRAASASTIVKVNDIAISTAYAANSFTRGNSPSDSPINSSNHMTVLLENLREGDTVKIETQNNANYKEPLSVPHHSYFSTFLEYIPDEQEILSASSDQINTGSDLNSASEEKYIWSGSINDVTYKLTGDSVIFNKGGNFLVSVNVPFFGTSDNQKIRAHIYVNDDDQNVGSTMDASNGYFSNYDGHESASTNYTNVLYEVPDGAVLDIRSMQLGDSGTVNILHHKLASLYIQKLDTTQNTYVGTGNDGTDWNVDFVMDWIKDYIIDENIFKNTTVDMTVGSDGDYIAYFSDRLISETDYISPVSRIKINGSSYPGAECSAHNMMQNPSTNQISNCDMQILLQDLKSGDKISFTSEGDTVAGTATSYTPKMTLRKVSE